LGRTTLKTETSSKGSPDREQERTTTARELDKKKSKNDFFQAFTGGNKITELGEKGDPEWRKGTYGRPKETEKRFGIVGGGGRAWGGRAQGLSRSLK